MTIIVAMTSVEDTPLEAALAVLADDVAGALQRFARTLRSGTHPTPTPTPPPVVAVGEIGDLKGLGGAQLRVLELLKEASPDGMTSVDVAKAAGLQSSNTPRLLKSLAERGLVRGDGDKPVVWSALE